MKIRATPNTVSSPVFTSLKISQNAPGNPTIMDAMIIKDIPLPIPRSVICSPIHITNSEPAVSVRTVIILNAHPGSCTT